MSMRAEYAGYMSAGFELITSSIHTSGEYVVVDDIVGIHTRARHQRSPAFGQRRTLHPWEEGANAQEDVGGDDQDDNKMLHPAGG